MTPLRAYRKANEKTLGDIAAAVGVTESQMSRIEREGTTVLKVALKLADITGAEPAEFLHERERMA